MNFFAELKRRNVIKVAVAYIIVGWLIMQAGDTLAPALHLPDWINSALAFFLILGFPLAMFFAWAFEITPDGIKKEKDIDRSQSITQVTGRKLDFTVIGLMAIALTYFIWESRIKDDTASPGSAIVIPAKAGTSTTQAETPNAVETPKTQNSIAVLPFINMSSDPEQEYFSDGITEEIINALVKIPGLSVPARTSVFGFKGQQGDVRKIGEQLGVAHILEGSIRSQGNQVRITAQLIKVDDGFHLWSETFDRQLDNIFVVQEEIAVAIAGVLTGELGLGVVTVPNQTRNMEAYDLYLQGRTLLRKRKPETADVLLKATQADPDFAPAWAALAIAYQVSGRQEQAMETAEKALQMDPDNVDALDALASALRTQRRWLESESYFDRALAIDPQSSELLEDYSEFLMLVGRADESLKAAETGWALDPNLFPLVWAYTEGLTAAGRPTEAIELIDQVLIARESAPWLWQAILSIRLMQEDFVFDADFVADLKIPADTKPTVTALLMDSTNEEAISVLKTWFSENIKDQETYSIHYSLARLLMVRAGLTDYVVDVDISQLESGRGMEEWHWTPAYQPLRRNPRYAEFLQTAGLIDYWDATKWPDWCNRQLDGKVVCK